MIKRPFQQLIEKTNIEVRWWSYAAWTLPFIALAMIGLSWFFGSVNLFEKVLLGIVLTFFSVSIFWWWWALFKFKDIVIGLDKTINSLGEVKKEIVKTRQVIQDSTSWENNDSSR